MNWNIKWIIIGAVLVILLVAFGRNPVDEKRRAQEEAAQRPDALIKAIEEHNSNPRSRFGGGSGGSGGGSSGGGSGSRGLVGWGGSDQAPAPSPGVGSRPNYPGYLNNPSNPFRTPPATSTPAMPPAASTPPANSYYPPPPVNAPPSQNNAAPPARFAPTSGIQRQLKNGQPVFFSGTEVYTTNAKGDVVSMPDGVYKMAAGRLTMVIRDGRRISIQ